MKKLLSLIFFSLLLSGNSYSETLDEKRSKYIYNNLSFEHIECQHYLIIASEALRTNDGDPKIIENYVNNAKLVGNVAFQYGFKSGMSTEAMLARAKMISDRMLKSLDNNFSNIAVIQLKYSQFCTNLIEKPEIRNQYWINKANKKYK